jgi:hypothetical protein
MADYFVIFFLVLFVAAVVVRRLSKGRAADRPANNTLRKIGRDATCFASGVLFANFVPHCAHGVSGEPFPAPFGKLLGPGFPSAASNVVWGVLNLAFGYYLFRKGDALAGDGWGRALFLSGLLAMGVFLSFLFSRAAA